MGKMYLQLKWMLSFHLFSIEPIGSASRRFQGQLREDCDIESVMLGVPTQAISCWEGRKKGKEGGRQAGRKAGRKEGQTKPGSLCDSSGRKVSRGTSPKHPMKSKATKTKMTSRNKTGVLLFLPFLPLCSGDGKGLYSHHLAVGLALSMRACLLSPLSTCCPSSDSVRFTAKGRSKL